MEPLGARPGKQSLGRVLVIGGCGFLGHHIVRQLIDSYTCSVAVLDLRTTQHRFAQVEYHDADIASEEQVRAVFKQTKPQVVMHTASPHGGAIANAKTRALYHRVNVEGTRVLLQCARECGTVRAFVFTSSASVVHDHRSDLLHVDERWPVLRAPMQSEYYSETKGIAETMVLEANHRSSSPSSSAARASSDALPYSSSKTDDFLTAAVRPATIFGEGDVQNIPPIVAAYHAGQNKFQLGSNDNLFDFTYVGNVAHAHILAAIALLQTPVLQPPEKERVDGEAFFITNGEPMYFWDYARSVWRYAGDTTTPEQTWTIPADVAMLIASVMEWSLWLVGKTPNLSKIKVRFSTMSRYFDITKARIRLGYQPLETTQVALERSVRYHLEQLSHRPQETSNMDKKSQ